jgi:hypothetical protein
MKGPADLLKAMDEPDRYGANYARNFAATVAVPFSVGMQGIAGQIDPYAREARTLLDAIKAKIPFVSETLHPRYDIWGQPVLNRDFVGVYSRELKEDPVNVAMERLGIFPSKPERKMVGIPLTDDQYDDFSRTAGVMSKQLANHVVAMPGFNSLPASIQKELLMKAIDKGREMMASKIKADSMRGVYGPENNIVQQSVDKKRALLTGSAVP